MTSNGNADDREFTLAEYMKEFGSVYDPGCEQDEREQEDLAEELAQETLAVFESALSAK
jgi:hypothetical protein